ncbi:hypothetical protein CK203_018156 [Vitis vinifera]|uniref:GAG-pre-integrase domain-containing protein n=1 Tax=Vitis vinifera TaxID=29760 RepID=A0A438EI90_VITVI|nr:hypothetical protein CK203_098398 [Vitis vinifera]RVX10759.1 hypothetical protein CK203_018156 [Vitis vinifera]
MATSSISLLAPQIFAGENYQIWTTKEAWDKLKLEYQGSDRTKQMQVLNLKRDFKSLTMSLGEKFPDAKIAEKVLVTLPERFESKISSLEESRDLSQISLVELMNALQAQEQRRALRQENVTEGQMLEKQYSLQFKDNWCIIFDPYGEKLLCMKMKSKSFAINWENASKYAYVGVTQSVSNLWHKRFGHYNQRSLVELKKLELVKDMPNASDEAQICEICQQGKQARHLTSANNSMHSTTKWCLGEEESNRKGDDQVSSI